MPRSSWWLSVLISGIVLALVPVLLLQTDKLSSNSLLRQVLFRRGNRPSTALHTAPSQAQPLAQPSAQISSVQAANMSAPTRTPVYFLSHGGPNIMEDYEHPAYSKLQEIGREITQKVKPKAVVVFSAHWQGARDVVGVNTAEQLGLIYDYGGFPPHYFEIQYPNRGDPALAARVLGLLRGAGIKAEGVRRGLDHGVFAPFRVAFDPERNPLGVPIVQVSLFDSEDADAHYRLGAALAALRDEGVLIVTSGMAVHNQREFFRSLSLGKTMPYALTFDDALKEAAERPPADRQRAMSELLTRKDARQAHPRFDHLLPIHIGAGAAGEDFGKQFWTMPQGSMSWAQFRFGEIGA